MRHNETHLSDQTLLAFADGELSSRETAEVAEHLAACWACRARRREMEAAVNEFVRFYRPAPDAETPSSLGPRALLVAQMAELSCKQPGSRLFSLRTSATMAALAATVVLAVGLVSAMWLRSEPEQAATLVLPDRSLTPGATVLMGKDEICRAVGTGNKAVPVALQRAVLRNYRMPSTAARAYEVDYLITPALGGADDIHNLWPESYATVWNARVKDQLEDYLRDRVCAGTLDLAAAQQDLAVNWIDAYRRYFHTDRPVDETHR